MIEPTRLDRLITYFLPARGAQRLAYRRQIEALAYEGARMSRREDSWLTSGSSANAELSAARLSLRNRARSLYRDNAYAVKAVDAIVVSRIGTGITASADSPNKRDNKKIDAQWAYFMERADYYNRTDGYGCVALAEATKVISGEALVRFVHVDPVDEDDIGLRVQVLEPDYLDTTRNERFSSAHEIIEGIEYGKGVPIAYWLFNGHPGDSNPILSRDSKSVRVDAADVLHYFKPLRPGQRSGQTEFAAVIRRLWDLDGYADAELMRKKIAACSVGFITTPGALPGASLGPTSIGPDGRRNETIAPGMYHYGKPGEQITFFDPKPSGDYGEFNRVELHAIAAGLGIPYELLTNDLSQVNYSSLRGGLVQFKARCEAEQWQVIIPQLCRPIWNRFVQELDPEADAYVPVKWTPPKFQLLDPAREVPSMIQEAQAGLRSWPEIIRSLGYEPGAVLAEIETWQKDIAERGIVMTSDARQNAGPSAQRVEPQGGGGDSSPEPPAEAKEAA